MKQRLTCGRLFCHLEWLFWVFCRSIWLALKLSLRCVIFHLCVQCSIVIPPGEKEQVGLSKTVLNHSLFMLRLPSWLFLSSWMVLHFLLLRLLLHLLIQSFELFILLLIWSISHFSGQYAGLLDCFAVAFFMASVYQLWLEFETFFVIRAFHNSGQVSIV